MGGGLGPENIIGVAGFAAAAAAGSREWRAVGGGQDDLGAAAAGDRVGKNLEIYV